MDKIFMVGNIQYEKKALEVDDQDIDLGEADERRSVNISDIGKLHKAEIADIVNNDERYKNIVVMGKKIKTFMRNQAVIHKVTSVKVYGLTITMFGDNPNDLTFVKLSAIVMLEYYNKNRKAEVDKLVIPALGSGLPKVFDKDNTMLCMAGPGAHFLVRHFYTLDAKTTDRRVGVMLAICMMLDWANYMRSHPESRYGFEEFMMDQNCDGLRNELGGVIRNMGDVAMAKLTPAQLAPLNDCIANAKTIVRAGINGAKIRTTLNNLFSRVAPREH